MVALLHIKGEDFVVVVVRAVSVVQSEVALVKAAADQPTISRHSTRVSPIAPNPKLDRWTQCSGEGDITHGHET